MSYVILDPGGEYPAAMIEFLGSKGRGAIAVFTGQNEYWAYKHMYEESLGGYILGEYVLPEWDDIHDVARSILHQLGGEVEGIIPWDERTIEIGAYLGDLIGAGWNSQEVIHRCRNKFAMKNYLRHYSDLRINESMLISNLNEAYEFQRYLGRWPIVVKPTEGAGTRGVSIAHSHDELVQGCVGVEDSGEGQILLEEYIGGTELVVNGIVDAWGDLLVTDVWAYDKRSNHIADNLYFQTIKLSTDHPAFWEAAEYAGGIMDCLGVTRAPIHMELKMDEYGPCLIEVGARFAGGGLPKMASQMHGRSLFDLAACHYLENVRADVNDLNYEGYDSMECRNVCGVQTWPIQRVSSVYGIEQVENLPSFHSWGKIVPVGSYLPTTTDMYTRSYEVFLMHPDPEQMEYDANAVRSLIHYA